MRLVEFSRVAALLSLSALLSACPKKDTDAVPEPAAPGAAQAPASDKAGAPTPAAPAADKKKDDDKGGW